MRRIRVELVAIFALVGLTGCCGWKPFSLDHYLIKVGTPVAKLPEGRKEAHFNPQCKASFYTRADMDGQGFEGPLYYSAGTFKMQRLFIKDGKVARVEIVRRNPWGHYDFWVTKTVFMEID